MAKSDLTAERLREILHYDPDTGIFLRLVNSRRRKNMMIPAGTVGPSGHIAIHIKSSIYQSHRLAWLYVYGSWPVGLIDHINGIPSDNRIVNLRSATPAINAQNKRLPMAGKLTPLGVSFLNREIPKRYIAAISKNGKKTFLGYFFTAEDAAFAYINAKRKFHEGCTI